MAKNKYKAESNKAKKEYKKYRMCERKKGYSFKEDASKYGKAYLCPYCKLYHSSAQLNKLAGFKINE